MPSGESPFDLSTIYSKPDDQSRSTENSTPLSLKRLCSEALLVLSQHMLERTAKFAVDQLVYTLLHTSFSFTIDFAMNGRMISLATR